MIRFCCCQLFSHRLDQQLMERGSRVRKVQIMICQPLPELLDQPGELRSFDDQ